jgi:hypothetical protein
MLSSSYIGLAVTGILKFIHIPEEGISCLVTVNYAATYS